jgi:hypothetical protein
LIVITRCDAIFEDRVEVGLDVIGVDELFVFVFILGGATFAGRRCLFVLFLLDQRIDDLVVDQIVDQVGFGVDVLEFFLEVGLCVFVELL